MLITILRSLLTLAIWIANVVMICVVFLAMLFKDAKQEVEAVKHDPKFQEEAKREWNQALLLAKAKGVVKYHEFKSRQEA